MEQVTVSGGTGVIDTNSAVTKPELPQALGIALATGQLRRPLVQTLRPLLDLLADGPYRIDGPERLEDERVLTPTGGWPPPDTTRVEYYRTAIQSGHRPVAVLLEAGDQGLILDGHHKIAAYRAEEVSPSVLRISSSK
ncbi:hypothetical protein [Amycolatopsis sp. H20-H5]|uniref:hypothetical protein n=1 Tax=Amycolatopsis sp. H20-H5 TaxID=3046309 RepID=UPI002DBC80E6|nr:hypothetical protein [Amycolatopsis sp. H20-H5]MEC3977020.1 hypothetical protein [Amycolatopsis sp. H20-H5]